MLCLVSLFWGTLNYVVPAPFRRDREHTKHSYAKKGTVNSQALGTDGAATSLAFSVQASCTMDFWRGNPKAQYFIAEHER